MKIKGKPSPGGPPLGNYGNTGGPVGDAGAVCEQMAQMQHSMKRLLRNGEELQDMTRQMLESMQDQHRAIDALLKRVDRASENSDRSVERICAAAETMEMNTQAIVRATLVAAFSLADDDRFDAAVKRADKEMRAWVGEPGGLRLASSGE